MIPMYNTMTLSEIYSDAESFTEDWKFWRDNSGFTSLCTDFTDEYVMGTYYLLAGKYATTPIANLSIDQFKLKLFSDVFMYGPAWAKKLKIQYDLRNLTIDDLREGQKYISNTALNPDQEPDDTIDGEIQYVNQQNVSKSKSGLLNTYANLWEILKNDVSAVYVGKFAHLFLKVVIPERAYIYTTEGEDE